MGRRHPEWIRMEAFEERRTRTPKCVSCGTEADLEDEEGEWWCEDCYVVNSPPRR